MKTNIIKININGRDYEVESGNTILEALRQKDIYIPTLCDDEYLEPFGGCRLCIVEIDGMSSYPSACTMPVSNGMVIRTESPELQEIRKDVLKIILSEHPLGCLVCDEKLNCFDCMGTIRKSGVTSGCGNCPKNNQCELQKVVSIIGVENFQYPVRYRMLGAEKKDPFIDKDFNLCILCSRCVRACSQQQFSPSLAIKYRGTNAIIGTAYETTFREAGCNFCGACVEVCPTGSLVEKTRKWEGPEEGRIVTTCPFCNLGCQMELLYVNGRIIGTRPAHEGKKGHHTLCVKGRFGVTELVNHPSRLKQPCLIKNGAKMTVEWDKAIEIAAHKIKHCRPGEFGMYVSPNQTNELMLLAYLLNSQINEPGKKPIQLSEPDVSGFINRLGKITARYEEIKQADLVIKLGTGIQYDGTVIEAELIALKSKPIPILEYPTNDNLLEVVESLVNNDMLIRSSKPLLIFHESLLHQRPETLEMVMNICTGNDARIIIYPLQNNLAGSWLFESLLKLKGDKRTDRVSYWAGENPQVTDIEAGFVIYQNILPPTVDIQNGLILPEAAFTEMNGAFTRWGGKGSFRQICKAVNPIENSKIGWKIIQEIIQKIGTNDINFSDEMEIQTEFSKLLLGENHRPTSVHAGAKRNISDLFGDKPLVYLGHQLGDYVIGLQDIYPGGESPEDKNV